MAFVVLDMQGVCSNERGNWFVRQNCVLIALFSLFSISLFLFQLLIGFESGIVVLWDLKSKKADYRYTYDEVGEHFLNFHTCGISKTCDSSGFSDIGKAKVKYL